MTEVQIQFNGRDHTRAINDTDVSIPPMVVTDPAQAWAEAHVERNIRELPSMMAIVCTTNALRYAQAVAPLDIDPLPDNEFSAGQQDELGRVERLLSRHAITERIDATFVNLATSFLNRNGEPTWLPEIRKEQKKVTELTRELAERERRREAAEASRVRTTMALSQKRFMYFVVDLQLGHTQLRVPGKTDPTTIKPGPQAVVEILGGKLTDSDYQEIDSQIRKTLTAAPHQEAQRAVDEYDFAVRRWIREREKVDSSSSPSLREINADLWRAARPAKKLFGPHSDIVTHAIFTSIVRRKRFSEAEVATPQPYSRQDLHLGTLLHSICRTTW